MSTDEASASEQDSRFELTKAPERAKKIGFSLLENVVANLLAVAIVALGAQSLGLLQHNTATTRVAVGIIFLSVGGVVVVPLATWLENHLSYRGRPLPRWIGAIMAVVGIALVGIGV